MLARHPPIVSRETSPRTEHRSTNANSAHLKLMPHAHTPSPDISGPTHHARPLHTQYPTDLPAGSGSRRHRSYVPLSTHCACRIALARPSPRARTTITRHTSGSLAQGYRIKAPPNYSSCRFPRGPSLDRSGTLFACRQHPALARQRSARQPGLFYIYQHSDSATAHPPTILPSPVGTIPAEASSYRGRGACSRRASLTPPPSAAHRITTDKPL